MEPDEADYESPDYSAYRKYAMWALYGPKITPEFAVEIIRRTDTIFLNQRGQSPYVRAVKRLLGVPLEQDYRAELADDRSGGYLERMFADLDRFRKAWGCVAKYHGEGEELHPVEFLSNTLGVCGEGWCYPDGTIALYEEIKRGYPDVLCDECAAVAGAFPELEFSACYWGGDGPEPTIGFAAKNGKIKETGGSDPDLFGRFGGLNWQSVIPVIRAAEAQARKKLPRQSRFGDRDFDRPLGWDERIRGLPDAIVEDWIARARLLGLACGE